MLFKISIAATKNYCHHCRRTSWFHRTFGKKSICRGDVPPSMRDKQPHQSVHPGCGVEVDNGPH